MVSQHKCLKRVSACHEISKYPYTRLIFLPVTWSPYIELSLWGHSFYLWCLCQNSSSTGPGMHPDNWAWPTQPLTPNCDQCCARSSHECLINCLRFNALSPRSLPVAEHWFLDWSPETVAARLTRHWSGARRRETMTRQSHLAAQSEGPGSQVRERGKTRDREDKGYIRIYRLTFSLKKYWKSLRWYTAGTSFLNLIYLNLRCTKEGRPQRRKRTQRDVFQFSCSWSRKWTVWLRFGILNIVSHALRYVDNNRNKICRLCHIHEEEEFILYCDVW